MNAEKYGFMINSAEILIQIPTIKATNNPSVVAQSAKVLFFLSKITCDQNVDTDPDPDGQGDHKGCDQEGKETAASAFSLILATNMLSTRL